MSATDATASTTSALPSNLYFTPQSQQIAAFMIKGLFFVAGCLTYAWLSTLFGQMAHHQPLHLGGGDWVLVAMGGACLLGGARLLKWYHEKTKKEGLPENTKRVVGMSLATFVFPPVLFALAYSADRTK